MGFLDNSNIGFAGIPIGGGSGGGGSSSSQNVNIVFKEVNSTLSSTDRNVASKAAASNIAYTLPAKAGVDNGAMFEIINMNASFNITIIDSEDQNIEGQESFVLNSQGNISIILDKDNSAWKIVNGI